MTDGAHTNCVVCQARGLQCLLHSDEQPFLQISLHVTLLDHEADDRSCFLPMPSLRVFFFLPMPSLRVFFFLFHYISGWVLNNQKSSIYFSMQPRRTIEIETASPLNVSEIRDGTD
jgi:hypothetical protein